MEDFLSMILLMVIYIGVAAANGNKKKKKRAKQARARGFQSAFDGRPSAGGERRAQQPESAQEGFLPAFDKDCEISVDSQEISDDSKLYASWDTDRLYRIAFKIKTGKKLAIKGVLKK